MMECSALSSQATRGCTAEDAIPNRVEDSHPLTTW